MSRQVGLVAAIRFLTIVPLFARREMSTEELGRSLVFFPVVGLLIGGLLYGLDLLFALFLPPALGSALVVLALVVITGAHHLDGLVDTCDAMAAGRSRQERLDIMRDSHAGGFGVVGAVLGILIKYVALLVLPGGVRMAAIILMPALGRWAMVWAISAYPYARESGMGRAFKEGATWWRAALATLIALVAAMGLLWPRGAVLVAAALLIVMALCAFFKGRFGGLTGDTYGAVNELSEISVLILVPVIAGGYL